MRDDDIDTEPIEMKPVKNDELRQAFRCVDAVRYRNCLDWVRDSLGKELNASGFITYLADKNPQKFIRLVEDYRNHTPVDWTIIEKLYIESNGFIKAVKAYREQADAGLKEAVDVVKKHFGRP